VKHAAIGPIAVHFPERVETNDQLQTAQPGWDMKIIGSKTGIFKRYIAAPDECSSDLGVAAAERLFEEKGVDRDSIDYLLFCTQTQDYALPTTACLLQHRLGLGTHVGAFDFNLGCSGFVYGLAIADGLIRTGLAENVLLITAETYTKMIHPDDRSLRTIFGDAGAATLIQARETPSLSGFKFGTDGSGANTLIANCGGFRPPGDAIPPKGRKRWKSDLYMDGAALIDFSIQAIPGLVQDICNSTGISQQEIRYMLFHQATRKMLEELHIALNVDDQKLPIRLEDVGNTVSCTLPILIDQMRADGSLDRESWNMLVGFGVGWSWGGCLWKDLLGSGG
jgi:3-oxoacyl-[acyl-carrier-protein] synthase-3